MESPRLCCSLTCDPISWHGMLALSTERKHHASTRPEDLACGGGSGPVGARRRGRSRRRPAQAPVYGVAQGRRRRAAHPRREPGGRLPRSARSRRLSEWRDRFLAAAHDAFRTRGGSPQDDGNARLTAIVGKQAVEIELLREKIARLEGGVPFHLQRSRK